VFGFDQEIGGEQNRVRCMVCNHHRLGRAEEHHRGASVALHFDLCTYDCRGPWPDHLTHLWDGLGSESHCGNSGRTVHPEHVGDAESMGHEQRCGIDSTCR
jgi:hypothetical protein